MLVVSWSAIYVPEFAPSVCETLDREVYTTFAGKAIPEGRVNQDKRDEIPEVAVGSVRKSRCLLPMVNSKHIKFQFWRPKNGIMI